ncbi:transport and Golgi organization 2-like protein, partial [Brachionus plicatilis]
MSIICLDKNYVILKMKIIYLYFVFIKLKSFEFCTSFYCINSCGLSKDGSNKGFKLILANNRDEDIYRPTLPASAWLSKFLKAGHDSYKPCDKNHKSEDLCVYGALDVKNAAPPEYYSTWLAINERGSVGNLLFYMQPSSHIQERQKRGIIVGSYLRNSSWNDVEEFLQYLSNVKSDFKPFNYVQLEMSKTSGKYSIYYLNNNNSKIYTKLNQDESSRFIFALSNSNASEPFNKVKEGKVDFEKAIDKYSQHNNKQLLVNEILNSILLNKTEHFPDNVLKQYMNVKDDTYVKGISQINANYGNYWKNSFSRTSTIILVDDDDNVEYYEYNLTKIENKITDFSLYIKELKSISLKDEPA